MNATNFELIGIGCLTRYRYIQYRSTDKLNSQENHATDCELIDATGIACILKEVNCIPGFIM